MTSTKAEDTICPDLIQLPNGNWIDPRAVRGIQYMAPSAGYGYPEKGAGDRVRVDLASGGWEFMEFSDAIDAIAFRDDLGREVNAARKMARAALKAEG